MTAISHGPANTKALQSPTSRVYFSDLARGMPFPFHSSVWMFWEDLRGGTMENHWNASHSAIHKQCTPYMMIKWRSNDFFLVESLPPWYPEFAVFDEKRSVFRFKAHADQSSELVCHHINRSRRVTDSRGAAQQNMVWSINGPLGQRSFLSAESLFWNICKLIGLNCIQGTAASTA